jgi:hypothetical protein
MFYSNEALLINTRYARFTNYKSFRGINIRTLHSNRQSKAIDSELFRDVDSRMVRIVDVLKDNSANKDNRLVVLVRLINELDRSYSKYLVCRPTDLLYCSRELHTVEKRVSSSYGGFLINYYRNQAVEKHMVRENNYHRGFYELTESTRHVLPLYEKLKEGTFVDKFDCRIKNNNRFYLNKYIREAIKKCTLEEQNPVIYESCYSCNNIGGVYRGKKFEDTVEYYCNWCYSNTKIPCDICLDSFPVMDLVEARAMGSITDLYLSNDIYKSCEPCINSFFRSCDRCKEVKYIDLEKIRGLSTSSEKRRYRDRWLRDRDSKLTRVNHSSLCYSCTNMRLTGILGTPYRFRSLPDKFAGKSEFNRFVGIESEVITEYDSVDAYVDSAEIPKHFEVVEDGSLNQNGVEFRTARPIIGEQVDNALMSLESTNANEWNEVDESCGVHIHMNAIDFGFKEIKSVLLIMSRIQDLIYESIPEDRRSTQYAKPITMSTKDIANIDNLPVLLNSYYGMENAYIDDSKYNTARYIGTNIHARLYHGSIEFRYHEGSVKSKPIKDWILFLNRIMSKSKELSRDNSLYSKIISNKAQSIDILRDVTGINGVEYIEKRIDKYCQ